jgi:hypothetical protein
MTALPTPYVSIADSLSGELVSAVRHESLGATVLLAEVDAELPQAELYERVTFEPADDDDAGVDR